MRSSVFVAQDGSFHFKGKSYTIQPVDNGAPVSPTGVPHRVTKVKMTTGNYHICFYMYWFLSRQSRCFSLVCCPRHGHCRRVLNDAHISVDKPVEIIVITRQCVSA